jgi:phage terminase large subunit-like protein
MQTGVGARQEPLSIAITTAGHDKHSLCYQQHEYAEKVRAGTVVDRSHLPVMFGAPIDADWKSPAVWRAANPNLGVSVEESFLQSECEKAQELPGHEISFRQLFFASGQSTKKRWISLESWAACAAPEIDEQFFAGKDIYIGVDLSTTTDLTSVAVITVDEEENVAFLSYAFCPEKAFADDRGSIEFLTTLGLRKDH